MCNCTVNAILNYLKSAVLIFRFLSRFISKQQQQLQFLMQLCSVMSTTVNVYLHQEPYYYLYCNIQSEGKKLTNLQVFQAFHLVCKCFNLSAVSLNIIKKQRAFLIYVARPFRPKVDPPLTLMQELWHIVTGKHSLQTLSQRVYTSTYLQNLKKNLYKT